MAFFSSLRRGALQPQPYIQGLLGEHRLLGVRFLRGAGKKKQEKDDSSKPANADSATGSDSASGTKKDLWGNPLRSLKDYYDKKTEFLQGKLQPTSSKKAGPKSDSPESSGGTVGNKAASAGDHGMGQMPGGMPEASEKTFGKMRPGGPTRAGSFSGGFGKPGNGTEAVRSQRMLKGVKGVLEDASKELEVVAKKGVAKKGKGKGWKLSSEAERELAAAETRVSKRAAKAGKGAAKGKSAAAAKKGKKKGKSETDAARPIGKDRLMRLARETLEDLIPGFSSISPSIDWDEEYRICSGQAPSNPNRWGKLQRVEREGNRGVYEPGRGPSFWIHPSEVTSEERKAASEAAGTRGLKDGSLEGRSGGTITRRGRKTKVTDGTVVKKATKEKPAKETRKPRTPQGSSAKLSGFGGDEISRTSETGGGAVSEDGLVRVTTKSLEGTGNLTPARGRKTGAVSVRDNAVSPLPEARQLYTEMKEREREGKPGPLADEDSSRHQKALAVLTRFTERGWASDQALALYVNHELYPVVAARFKDLVLRGSTDKLAEWFWTTEPSDAAEEALFPLFAELCLQEFRAELRQFRKLVESANLTEPEKWYPYARAMKRKIVYHCGPTNSGKTYEALQRLKQADNGLYCGPLRLLAMEIFDTLNADGVYCNLTTGQERRTMPFANHTSCTVEMAHLGNEYEVAVIDEIQMMADDHRGWAWTRALLGLQAKEVHVCGDSSVLKRLQDTAETCGDEFVVRNYERWKPLCVEDQALGGTWQNVTEGDCVVAFSRKEIFRIKEEIEAQGDHNCCVIYGALPPETRRQQAKLFNDPNSDYKVLVASDAIGMGLNLNIRRMVFSTMEKFAGGTGKETIPTPMVKQIAGRAGRRNSSHPEGLATAFYSADLAKLRDAMDAPMQTAQKAGLFPIFEQMELFAGQLPDVRFPALLDKFAQTSLLDSSYFLCKHDQIRTIALLLEEVPSLSLRDRFSLCQAPVNTRSPEAMGFLLSFAKAYADGNEVPLKIVFGGTPDIQELEWKHQVVSAYLWLSYQLQATQFPHRGRAEQLLTSMVEELDRRLADRVNKRGASKRFFRQKGLSFMPALGKPKGQEGLAVAAAV